VVKDCWAIEGYKDFGFLAEYFVEVTGANISEVATNNNDVVFGEIVFGGNSLLSEGESSKGIDIFTEQLSRRNSTD
jgi:hypothetical protein